MLTHYPRTGGYNEIVLDATHLEAHLPDAIQGFFYPLTTSCIAATACKRRAERAQAAFRAEFGSATTAPLLTLNSTDWRAPFSAAWHDGNALGDTMFLG